MVQVLLLKKNGEWPCDPWALKFLNLVILAFIMHIPIEVKAMMKVGFTLKKAYFFIRLSIKMEMVPLN
jgi:hypothetical protein